MIRAIDIMEEIQLLEKNNKIILILDNIKN